MGILWGGWLTPAFIWKLGLVISIAGTASSTVFLLMVLVAAWQFRRSTRATSSGYSLPDSALPAVSLLKPVH